MILDFCEYLVNRGYREVNDQGRKSTVYSYRNAIEKICNNYERININTLFNNIDDYVKLYGPRGIKESIGKASNNTNINALRRFHEFSRVYKKI